MFIKKDLDKIALIYQNEEISYTVLQQRITQYIKYFQGKNIEKIALFAENRAEWFYLIYAAWECGIIFVPVDHMATSEEVHYILKDVTPDILFTSEKNYNTALESLGDTGIELISLDQFEVPESGDITTLKFDYPQDDVAIILYTSGTTGSPKGVMLTFDNVMSNLQATSGIIYQPEDRVLLLLPLHHILPLQGTLLMPLFNGGTSVIAPSLSGPDIVETLNKYQITMMVAVPRLYDMIHKGIKDKINKSVIGRGLFALAGKINSPAFSRKVFKQVQDKFGGHLRYLVSGGAALDERINRDMHTLGFHILEGYGLSETSPMITFPRPKNTVIGSVGEVIADVEMKILDGEVLAKGRNVMKGYYNKPEETAAVLKDGWLYTGDLGRIDPKSGHLFITGRKKEIIVLPNGKNINPVLEEFKLMEGNPTIGEIAVFDWKNMLHVVICPDLSVVRDQEITDLDLHFQEMIDRYNRGISDYKKIARVHISRRELPKTRLNKIQRFKLIDFVSEEVQEVDVETDRDDETYIVLRDFLQGETGEKISSEKHLEIDLGLDSLGKITLLTFIDSTFGVKLQEQELLNYMVIGKLADYLNEQKTRITVEDIDWEKILRKDLPLALPRSTFWHPLIRTTFKYLLKGLLRIKVKGVENIPNEGPFIIAPNHQSVYDGIFAVMYLKNSVLKNTYFFAKEKHFKKKWRIFLGQRTNVIVMDLHDDIEVSIQKMASVLKQKGNIIIFPEGTRTKDGDLNSFKKTFAILSKELNVPIVPVAIDGAYRAFPGGGAFPKLFKPVQLSFLTPILPEDYQYLDLANRVKEVIESEIKEP